MSISSQTIRIGFTEEEPFAYSCIATNQSKCTKYGTDLEYVNNVITGALQLNISWIYYNTFNDINKALDSNEIDLIGNGRVTGLASSYNGSWYQTFPLSYLIIGFFVKSHFEPEKLNPFRKFTWDLWLTIMSVTLLSILLRKIVCKRLRLTFLTLRFFYLFWFVTLSLIMELYGNILTADLLLREKATTSFTDLNDLGKKLISKKCQFAIFEKYLNLEDFDYVFKPDHNLSWANNFRTAYKTNPPMILKNKKDLLEVVKEGPCIIGLDLVTVDTSPYDSLCNIDVKIFPDEIPIQRFGYYHKLESLKTQMDIVITSDAFVELPKVLLKRYLNIYTTDTDADCKVFVRNFEISLSQLFYCFVILIGGIIFAGIVSIFLHAKRFYFIHETERESSLGMSEIVD